MNISTMRWVLLADALQSWRLWVGVAVFVTLTPFLSLVPVSPGPAGTLVGSIAAAVTLLVVVGFGWLVMLRHLQGPARLVAGVPVVLVAAMSRGLVLQGMLADGPNLHYWMTGSCLTVMIAVATALLVKVGIESHRQRLEDLVAEQQRLSAVLTNAEEELSWHRGDAVSEVTANVVQQLAEIPDTSATLTLHSLEHMAADVVRPLSYELATAATSWEPPPVGSQRLEWSRVWGSVADVELLDPWGPTIIVLLSTPASALVMGVGPALLMHLLMALATLLSLSLVRRLAKDVAGGRSTPVRLVVAYALLVLGCVPSAVIAVSIPGPSSSVAKALWMVLVLPIAALLLSVVRAARIQQKQLEVATGSVAQQTHWWISRTRMVHWWQRAALARALHGPVQSAIAGAVQRLRKAEGSGQATPDVVRAALNEVRAALSAAVLPETNAADISARMAGLAQTWRLVAEVTCDLAPEEGARLQQDPVCAEIVMDVIREAVSNAVRHGAAAHVTVSAVVSVGSVRIEVRDDGRGLAVEGGPRRSGLGTAMLDACALSWGLRREGAHQVLWAELPWLVQQPTEPAQSTEASPEGPMRSVPRTGHAKVGPAEFLAHTTPSQSQVGAALLR